MRTIHKVLFSVVGGFLVLWLTGEGLSRLLRDRLIGPPSLSPSVTIPKGSSLQNPDFEAGITGWSSGDAQLRAVEGGQSGKCLEIQGITGNFQYAIQWDIVSLEIGKSYALVFWVKSGSPASEPFRVGFWDNREGRWVAAQDGHTTDRWTQHSLEFTNTTSNPLSVEIVKNSPSKGSLLVDSLRLGKADEIEPGFYVENGDFENGMAGWDGGQASLRNTGGGQTGNCLELAPAGGDFQYAIQWNGPRLSLRATYEFSFWVKSGSSGDQPFRAGVWDKQASQWAGVTEGISSQTWTAHRIEFTNTTRNPVSFELIKNSPMKGTMLFDSVSMRKLR
jgi:hypothetical protein